MENLQKQVAVISFSMSKYSDKNLTYKALVK